MTESIEQTAQRILDTVGYLVVEHVEPHEIGKVLTKVEGWEGVQFAVTAETNINDFIAQARLAGATPRPREACFYYRVVAE